MEINKNNPTPLYLQIANIIREKIYSNEWEAGSRIQSENELRRIFNVSRGTLKKALDLLVEEGLLVQVHGKGTFVSEKTVTHPIGKKLLSFAESLEQQGLNFQTKVITEKLRDPTISEKKKFNLKNGEKILYLERVRYVDNEPIMFIENRININICPELCEVDFNKESLFSTIEDTSGKKIKYAISRYAARVIGEERSKFLEIDETSPILHLEQTVFLEDDTPIEWGNVWLKANKYIVATVVSR